jgi:hypothetical protein
MSKRKTWEIYLLLIVVLSLSASCANRVVPQGGPVDEDPPELLSSSPENMSVSFNEERVVLRFDEYIRLENQDQIFISPPLSEPPRFRADGKEVIVELPEVLSPEITYTISFGNSIVDNNEGNAFRDFKYVFSTGSTLDSLILEGRVLRAEDLKPEKDAIVVLYPDTVPDSSVFRIMPTYYSRLTDDGYFTLHNIRAGDYRLFAIEDANRNFLAEVPSERIAFYGATLEVPADTFLNLFTFKQRPGDIKVLNSRSSAPGISVVTFNGPASDASCHLLRNELIYSKFNTYGDSLWLYHKTMSDSTGIVINTGIEDDTLWTFRKLSGDDFFGGIGITGFKRNGSDSLDINFNLPFKVIRSDNILIDTTVIEYVINQDERDFATMITVPRPDSTATLLILPGSINDINDMPNDSIDIVLSIPEERQTGILELNITPPDSGNTYVVLTDASGMRIEKLYVAETGTFEVSRLIPGKYVLSSFLDVNEDSEWTPGDFYGNIQPEKVLLNASDIVIRANWSVQIEWTIDN